MQSKFTLRYLPAAQDDLLSLMKFIARDNPDAALSFINKIDDRIGELKHFPLMGVEPKDYKLRKDGYRVLIFESHLVFYIIRGKVVEIHRVIHGSRNLDFMF